jgi:hypothetical protein
MSLLTIDCPSWEYETVTGWHSILTGRSKAALIRLRQLSPDKRLELGKDGRPVHAQYFVGLTPPGCDYYAGHYRSYRRILVTEGVRRQRFELAI